MNRLRSNVIAALLLAGGASIVACGGDDSASPGGSDGGGGNDAAVGVDAGGGRDSGGGADAGTSMDSGGGGMDSGTDSAPPPPQNANVRVAHLSPDAPAVDFCVAAHGTTSFIGPVLKGAGAASGLAFGNITKYLPLPVAQYDVRIVAPNAADCSKSLAGLPDVTNLPALSAGGSYTIAAEGELAQGATNKFAVTAYVDDGSVTAGKAKLRFVHASPSTPAVDVGVGGGVLFTGVFNNVAFGAIGTGGGLSATGYLETAPLTNVEISARAHGAITDVIAINPANLPAGAIATAFAIGKIGDATHPLKVLLCVDNGAPNGLLSACSQVGDTPKRAHVRVAHLSPDAPAVDVCIKPHAAADFSGSAKLLNALGVPAGLAYSQVTQYVDLPVSAYDIRVVLPNAASCTGAGAVPDTNNVAVTDGLSATVAATGDLTVAGSDPGFALKVFVDETTVTSGKGKLRFVHAAPSIPPVDVGLGSGASFTAVFTNVPFGKVASNSGIDANGYIEVAPLSNQTISARATGSTADALVVPGVTLPANAIATAFAIGAKTGASTNPLKVLLCVDSAAPANKLAVCSVVP